MRKQLVIAPTVAAMALMASLLTGTASPAVAATASGAVPFATCGAIFNGVTVAGGLASWNITCPGSKVRITGTLKDTDADGKCAYIKAFADNGESRVPLATACRKGTTVQYDWTTTNPGREIRAYLFTA